MAVLIERVDDDLYVNPIAVDYVSVHRTPASTQAHVEVHFRSGKILRRETTGYAEAQDQAKRWQSLLNVGNA